MGKVLVATFFFPPLGGAGVQRALKNVRYLPEAGWQPVVLTSKPGASRLLDPSLEKEVDPGLSIYRASALLLPEQLPWRLRRWITRWLLLVDDQIGWLPFAVREGEKAIHREGVQAIYTTSTPYTTHLVGYLLKRRTGMPWVADFRDPWLSNAASNYPTRLHRRLVSYLERKVCLSADSITVVSEPMRQSFLYSYPSLDASKVITIPNGFDPEDFKELSTSHSPQDRMQVVYTGSFYSNRTPRHFFNGLQKAITEQQVPRQKIHVRLVGNTGKSTPEQIEKLGLGDVVSLEGYLPHWQSIACLLEADVLLLVIAQEAGSQAVLTGKIFEYLAARKPILALAPPGAAADLMREAEAGVVVDPEDSLAIAVQIANLYQQWQQGRLQVNVHPDIINRFDRRRQAARLGMLLDQVTSQKAIERV